MRQVDVIKCVVEFYWIVSHNEDLGTYLNFQIVS